MTHGSLFSGIGGAELAAQWAGWENVFHCEINPFGRKVLDYYWPKAKSYADIKQTNFSIWRNRIDVLTGGFPCQPFSAAGKRKGTEDDRHLWPEMLRAIQEIQPRYIVGENVRGFTNWGGGLVFDQALSDLENEGYEVTPFLLPACGVNAPHRRDRIWIVAYRCSDGSRRPGKFKKVHDRGIQEGMEERYESHSLHDMWSAANSASDRRERTGEGAPNENGQSRPEHSRIMAGRPEGLCSDGDVADANGQCMEGRTNGRGIGEGRQKSNEQPSRFLCPDWQNFPTQPPIRSEYDGISRIMVRNIKSEVYATIRKNYTDKDLQEVRNAFQSEEIQWKIGRLYKIYEPGILLKTMQLCQTPNIAQGEFSPFGEEASKGLMRKLRKFGEFGCSPHGRELEEQFRMEFNDSLPYLSHEIALAAMEVQKECKKFSNWHRNESIKAFGNAWVPQVAYEIFKVINEIEFTI